MTQFEDRKETGSGVPDKPQVDEVSSARNSSPSPESSTLPALPRPLDSARFISELRSYEPDIGFLNETLSYISEVFIIGDVGVPNVAAEHERLAFLVAVVQELSASELDDRALCKVMTIVRDTLDHEATHRPEHFDILGGLSEWLLLQIQKPRFLLDKTVDSELEHDFHSATLMLECIQSLLDSRVTHDLVDSHELRTLLRAELAYAAAAFENIVDLADVPYRLLDPGSNYISHLAQVARQVALSELQGPLTELVKSLSMIADGGELADQIEEYRYAEREEISDLSDSMGHFDNSFEQEEEDGDYWHEDDLDDQYDSYAEDLIEDEDTGELDPSAIEDVAAMHLQMVVSALVTCQKDGELVPFWEGILALYEIGEAEWGVALSGLTMADHEAARPYVERLIDSVVRALKSEPKTTPTELSGPTFDDLPLASRVRFDAITELLLTAENAGDLLGEVFRSLNSEEQMLLADLAHAVVNDEEFSATFARQDPNRSVQIDEQLLEIFAVLE